MYRYICNMYVTVCMPELKQRQKTVSAEANIANAKTNPKIVNNEF